MSAPEVGLDVLAAAIDDGGYVLDVREPDEFAEARIPEARPMPMRTVPDRQAELPRDEPVYVVCAVGGRSRQVADYLHQLGVDTYNVSGGVMAWAHAGRPMETGQPST